ncbi:FAD-binding oxidoreductase [Pseudooceanicola marinus]|uniref:FAD-binding oxidoreductase n=1 Tax=Pseudooceanicola marinus TaxID=396013 RepID=UPI001CD2723F|nr:FAD-binding oxidoreductase [Pseudooceanicola marinus]MCA1338166.1 FAD-binding oxidoreductase [Pseudooceanicola marinus]
MKLSGWGRYSPVDCRVLTPRAEAELAGYLQGEDPVIARGNGRAYGDPALNEAATISMRRLDRMISFDPATGVLVAQAGVLLADVISSVLPQGWFPLVTPGTRFVTLGGMAASDVHGKNHHVHGSFRASVLWLDLVEADGQTRRVSPEATPELFDQTLGGMGLTGLITRLAIQLTRVESGWIRQETIAAPNLKAAINAFEDNAGATYSVAWIDCLARGADLGRSLVMLGEHACLEDLPRTRRRRPFATGRKALRKVPFLFPGFVLNRWTVRAFNRLYYWKGRKATSELVDWESYFYPLDSILEWNRIYGRRGFVQFQCVFPLARSEAGLTQLLQQISEAGEGSFLAVLKRFGPQESAFSFPMEGYTLALDFPARPRSIALLKRLFPIVRDHGGRFYLAKDALLDAEMFFETDGRAPDFATMRTETGRKDVFSSRQSRRLGI